MTPEQIVERLRKKYVKDRIFLDYIRNQTSDSFIHIHKSIEQHGYYYPYIPNAKIQFEKWDTSPEDMPAGTEHCFVLVSSIKDDSRITFKRVDGRIKRMLKVEKEWKMKWKRPSTKGAIEVWSD